MTKRSTCLVSKCLFVVVACSIAATAHGLTITPTFDSSITGPNAAAMKAAINAAIQVLETNCVDNFTVGITFVADTGVALGQSQITFPQVKYSSYRAALKSKATSANDVLALSNLPQTSTDPVIGGTDMDISAPLAKMLGLSTTSPNGSSIHFNPTIVNFTRPNPNNNNYDLQSVIEHEIVEVLGGGGSGCNAGSFPQIGATDLFRYATNSSDNMLERTWTTNGDNAYFSVDGTNLWARFNMDPNGDLGDFWGFNQDPNTYLPLYWSPPGVTPQTQVQNAFATPSFFSYPANFEGYPTTNYYYENTAPDLGTNEFTMLDVIGWTLTPQVAPPFRPGISIVATGTNKIMLSWPTNVTGYTLQQRTNLSSGSWAASPTGGKSPAVITVSGVQQFFRVFNTNATPALVPIEIPPGEPVTDNLVQRPARPGIQAYRAEQ